MVTKDALIDYPYFKFNKFIFDVMKSCFHQHSIPTLTETKRLTGKFITFL